MILPQPSHLVNLLLSSACLLAKITHQSGKYIVYCIWDGESVWFCKHLPTQYYTHIGEVKKVQGLPLQSLQGPKARDPDWSIPSSCQAYRASLSSVDTRITLYSSIVHWVEIEPWERVQGLPLQSRQGPKARDRPVAKHIAPHCSIHKQPHILPSSVDTWVTHQQLRFVWDRQGPPWPLTCWGCRPPWRPRCWCCGHFFSNSRAWPWQFQAPNLLVRYKLKPKE